MSDDGGFVRAHRKVFTNPVFRNHAEAMAFIYLIMRAAWKPTRVRYKDRLIVLERGQVAVSVRDLARHMDRSKDWAQRFLQRLADRDMIATATATGVNVLSICNYNEYQETKAEPATVHVHPSRHDRDSAATQNKELKEGKEGKRAKALKDTGLPDWLPIPAWEGWLEMRRAMRKPATARAQVLAIKKLEGFRQRGMSAEASLEQSTMSGWTDLYEPKRAASKQDIPW